MPLNQSINQCKLRLDKQTDRHVNFSSFPNCRLLPIICQWDGAIHSSIIARNWESFSCVTSIDKSIWSSLLSCLRVGKAYALNLSSLRGQKRERERESIAMKCKTDSIGSTFNRRRAKSRRHFMSRKICEKQRLAYCHIRLW